MFQKKRNNKKEYKLSIQTKLISVFVFTTAIIVSVNMYVYVSINQMIARIDQIYMSNSNLNELQNGLNQVHANMTEYLNTKSSDSMEEYFRGEQNYTNLIKTMNTDIVGDKIKMTEKNIYNMSLYYLNVTNNAVEAKRGRNIEKSRTLHEEANELYGYINAYIYSLNNIQFQNNSQNYEVLFASLKYSEAISMVILCLAGVFNTVLIIMLTKGITRPLKQLAEAADRVAGGQLTIEPVEPKSNDEVGVVTRAFNQMVISIQVYIKRLKESLELEIAMKEKELMMENHLKDAQLKYLQTQINPHFLFNTLNAGAQLAMMENAERTYQYIQNTADFFRYNLKKINKSVSLEEEIELIDNYIYIINVRFSGDINFKKTIDESLIDVQVPGMILQPIVENSLNYGIRDIDWEGAIELSVYKAGENICVAVRDNGIGISQEKIEKILHGQLQENDIYNNSNGIGLDNVIGRLRIFFDRENVVEIISEGENMGTEVVIYIPIKEKQHV